MEMDKLIDSPGLMTLSIRYNKKRRTSSGSAIAITAAADPADDERNP